MLRDGGEAGGAVASWRSWAILHAARHAHVALRVHSVVACAAEARLGRGGGRPVTRHDGAGVAHGGRVHPE